MKRIGIRVDEFTHRVAGYDHVVAAQQPLLQQHGPRLYTRGLLGHWGIKTRKYLSAVGRESVTEAAATMFALRHW